MTPPIPPMLSAVLDQFEPISISSLPEVVHHLRPTNCPSDSIPVRLLEEVFDTVSPCILSLINTCRLSGCVPAAFKHVVVQPLLKKENLDPSVLIQLQTFLFDNNVPETALLRSDFNCWLRRLCCPGALRPDGCFWLLWSTLVNQVVLNVLYK